MKPSYYEPATRHLLNAGIDFKVFDIYNPPSIPSAAELEAVEKIKKCHDVYMAECLEETNLEHIKTVSPK